MYDSLIMPQVAYKGFNSDFCCINYFQLEVGQKYIHNGKIELCHSGFHACINPADVLSYYYHDQDRYAEVLVEDFILDDDKLVAKIITIVREIPRIEFYDICSGRLNSKGKIQWFQNGKLHRDNDKPAVKYFCGSKEWWFNGKCHRDNDKPAIICKWEIIGGDGIIQHGYNVQRWLINDRQHRENDQPAVIWSNGDKEWWFNGKCHRDNDKPAIIGANGDQEWWVNGYLHRDNDQPAVIRENGDQEWWINGERHRDNDKPAIIRKNGRNEWFLNGIYIKYLITRFWNQS